jgi:type II secretory ATPase GspE/PulE/Tfp pilus assembly ATPase PilB-like protein
LLGRLRLDGELQILPELSALLSIQLLLPHLKLQAGLDIEVRRRLQDDCSQQQTSDSQTTYGSPAC